MFSNFEKFGDEKKKRKKGKLGYGREMKQSILDICPGLKYKAHSER